VKAHSPIISEGRNDLASQHGHISLSNFLSTSRCPQSHPNLDIGQLTTKFTLLGILAEPPFGKLLRKQATTSLLGERWTPCRTSSAVIPHGSVDMVCRRYGRRDSMEGQQRPMLLRSTCQLWSQLTSKRHLPMNHPISQITIRNPVCGFTDMFQIFQYLHGAILFLSPRQVRLEIVFLPSQLSSHFSAQFTRHTPA
jgi:hypothetical protein